MIVFSIPKKELEKKDLELPWNVCFIWLWIVINSC